VAYAGEPVVLSFSTLYSAPDVLRIFPNGTQTTLVSNGAVAESYNGVITSVCKEYEGCDVTLNITAVTKNDAGTYLIRSQNDLPTTEKFYIELIDVGKLCHTG